MQPVVLLIIMESLTISDFTIIGQEYINWEVSYGTFSEPAFTTGYLNGSYIDDGSTVSLTSSFLKAILMMMVQWNGYLDGNCKCNRWKMGAMVRELAIFIKV